MDVQTSCELTQKNCVPCEGGVEKYSPDQAALQIQEHPGWEVTHQHERIRKTWVVKNFMSAIKFFNAVAEIAEAEGHHPDLHLCGYRNVEIEIWTHAIGGLSENDFILAAKIDQLPIEAK
ncbi:MAG: 4a-hydroxytetrahydrobiopterin dehydratase [Planctomycetaceae bacterium]|nr:4a-hydroxytetrahydrobiopterin dehydratase [Planctomycetaceae bacterium]